jgi:virulence factor
MERLRAAVIGAGGMANRVHYPSLSSFTDVEVAAICDLDPDRLESTAKRWSVAQRFTDYRDMVDKVQPDAVYAIGQPHMMYDVWTWCLEQGCNLYIEKPPGLTLHQAEMLAYLAEEHGAVTQVSFQRRSSPLLQKARELCLERGPVVHAVCEFYKFAPTPFTGARDHMMDDGVHGIDTLRWACDGDVIGVDSHCRRVGTPDVNWIGAMLYFDNGSVGVLINSWSSGRRLFRVQLHADGVFAEVDPEVEARVFAEGDTEGQRYTAQEVAGSDELWANGGFRAKHREFVDSILTGKDITSSPLRDAVKTMEVAEVVLANSLLSHTSAK